MNSNEFVPTHLTMTGKSYEDIVARLYQMYGSNYTVINRKTDLKGGFLGLFQKPQVSVTYIVKDKSRPEPEDFNKSKNNLMGKIGVDANTAIIIKQIADISKKIEKINDSVSSNDVHPNILKIEQLLEMNEFSHNFISVISSKIRNEFTMQEIDDFDTVERKVVDWIGQSIKISPRIFHKAPHVIVLVGPTGVGKTTTLSKMAANFILEARNKGVPTPVIRLITIDKTRVGAEVQLRKFGGIMNIQVDKAENAEDLNTLYQECKNSVDYILIDSSGYSPNDFENIGKMRAILNVPGINFETYLTVTASTKASDLLRIIQNYEVFNFSSVIITKCDETSTFGNVLSILAEKGKSISYITDGQKVPRNIRKASVIEFLKNLVDFKIDRTHIEDLFPEEN